MLRSRVGACIISYQDAESVQACVKAIQLQTVLVEKLLIIDNSSYCKLDFSDFRNIIIEKYPENLGVSGGLYLGLQWAISQEYDFLWTFDQDSQPVDNCLKDLLNEYHSKHNNDCQIGIIAPTSVDPRTNRIIQGANFQKNKFVGYGPPDHNYPYECDSPITSGSLISIHAAKQVPLPNLDLFIDGVDFDYGLSLKRIGYCNFIVPEAILVHHFGTPKSILFRGQKHEIQIYSGIRHYYICRNHTYLELKYSKGFDRIRCFFLRLNYLKHTIQWIVIGDSEQKNQKIWLSFLGTFHGVIGKLGKLNIQKGYKVQRNSVP